MPTVNAAFSNVTACSSAPRNSLPNVGTMLRKVAASNQNQEISSVSTSVVRSAAATRISRRVERAMRQSMRSAVADGGAGGMRRAASQPSEATAITLSTIGSTPWPCMPAMNPPMTAPSRIAM